MNLRRNQITSIGERELLSAFPGAVLADLRENPIDCEEMATFRRVRVLADCVVVLSPSFGLSDTHTGLSTSTPVYTHSSLSTSIPTYTHTILSTSIPAYTHTRLSTSIPAYTHTSLLSMSKSKPSVLFATSTMSSNSWTTPKTTHAYRLLTTFARQRFSQSSTTHSISIQRWSSSLDMHKRPTKNTPAPVTHGSSRGTIGVIVTIVIIVSDHIICIVCLLFRFRGIWHNHAPNASERAMEMHYMGTSPAAESSSTDDDDILYAAQSESEM